MDAAFSIYEANSKGKTAELDCLTALQVYGKHVTIAIKSFARCGALGTAKIY